MSTTERQLRFPAGLIAPVVMIVVWEIAARMGELPKYLVAPSAIFAQFWVMVADGDLFVHAGASLYRALMGFAIGAMLGAAIGLWAGAVRPLERFTDPIISLTYPIPKIAVLPIIFAWFGLGDASKIVVITASVFYPVYIAAFYGAKATRTLHVWSAKNMGANAWDIFRRVVVPSALPQLFGGLRIGLALSFIVMFTAELIASSTGLGYLISSAENQQRFDIMYVAIIAIGAIGFIADRLLLTVRRRVLTGQLLANDLPGG